MTKHTQPIDASPERVEENAEIEQEITEMLERHKDDAFVKITPEQLKRCIAARAEKERKACYHEVWKEYDRYDEMTMLLPVDISCRRLCERLMFNIQKRGEK